MKHTLVNEMNLRFLSRSANEGFARAAIAAFVSQLDPTLEELNDIKTAVSEAVTNAIVHAYRDPRGYIQIGAKINDAGLVSLPNRDRGCGIEDVAQARQPMYTTGGSERSGMGFVIMESFMDACSVHSTVGRGTTVRLRKQINARTGGRKGLDR